MQGDNEDEDEDDDDDDDEDGQSILLALFETSSGMKHVLFNHYTTGLLYYQPKHKGKSPKNYHRFALF